jgi:hypothetical protein
VNHTAGAVAPVSKTVTYGTVTNIPGEPTKCWITRNLGASQQATAVNDATEASAGWYWQFNRKQGYKHDGMVATPVWPSGSIEEDSDWIQANDPCGIELGIGWRIPTHAEWFNVNNIGTWTNWNGPWNSQLKIHAAGFLLWNDGAIFLRGIRGQYYSNAQNGNLIGTYLEFENGYSSMSGANKRYGNSIRCIKN